MRLPYCLAPPPGDAQSQRWFHVRSAGQSLSPLWKKLMLFLVFSVFSTLLRFTLGFDSKPQFNMRNMFHLSLEVVRVQGS